jgi:hypothetical protein
MTHENTYRDDICLHKDVAPCQCAIFCRSVKYYILKWMNICISKLQTYISILTLIEIVYHVYILFSEYALHWLSRVLFIATQREIISLTELIKVENVNKYLFPKLNKNEISMFLYCKNVNISLAAQYVDCACRIRWTSSNDSSKKIHGKV